MVKAKIKGIGHSNDWVTFSQNSSKNMYSCIISQDALQNKICKTIKHVTTDSKIFHAICVKSELSLFSLFYKNII